MTIQNSNFNSIGANELQIDKSILADHWQKLAENSNCLYSLACGAGISGTTPGVAGHDHGANGGPEIPFYTTTEIGYISASCLNGYNTRVPFCRIFSSANYTDYLGECSSPFPVIDGSRSNNYTNIWFSGDVADSFAYGEWLTFNDGLNNGRYIYKTATYYSEVNATRVCLFNSLASIPTGGETVRVYKRHGETEFALYLPEWARTLIIRIPMAATMSISYEEGEIFYVPQLDDYNWLFRARLYSGGTEGDWLNVMPSKTQKPVWCSLQLDVSELTKNTVLKFGIKLEMNNDIVQYLPVEVGESECFIWFEANNYPGRRNIMALLSSVK